MDLSAFHPSRRALIRGVLMASGFAPSLLWVVSRADANSSTPILPGIQEMSGNVRINGNSAIPQQEVRSGDIVTTGSNSHCIIIIGENVYLIAEDSEIEFYPEYFGNQTASPSGFINMARGAMLAVFATTNTMITTPVATIGIRGTASYIEVQEKRTYACICYGEANLGSAQDGKHLETVKTTHHDSPRYIYPVGSANRIENAPVINHTDKELRMLEKLVNRRPAFDKNSPLETGKEY